jgi:hypothetical protein
LSLSQYSTPIDRRPPSHRPRSRWRQSQRP